jgi:hypothetical protein
MASGDTETREAAKHPVMQKDSLQATSYQHKMSVVSRLEKLL